MIGEAFQTFDIVSDLTKVRMEEWLVQPDEWHASVDDLAYAMEDELDKRRMATWKRAMSNKRAGVDLFPNYDEKSNTFQFTVRAYKKLDDGGLEGDGGNCEISLQGPPQACEVRVVGGTKGLL